MYVAVKGGERAIESAHDWLAEARRGDRAVPELGLPQIREQLALSVARVMAEGSLYDEDLAALAIKQARGDLIEAIFLIRAYRTTLPRFGASLPLDTGAMVCIRRISATYKDAPGGQVLGPTFDYTHRLLDFALAADANADHVTERAPDRASDRAPDRAPPDPTQRPTRQPEPDTRRSPMQAPIQDRAQASMPEPPPNPLPDPVAKPHITAFLDREGLIQPDPASDAVPPDLTRSPMAIPAARPLRLQALTRGDEGFVLAMGYSTQRGYGRTHPFVGELRVGWVSVEIDSPELGFSIEIADILITECETVNQFTGSRTEPPQFTRGYGLVFGHSERKAISMALVDRSLRWDELGEDNTGAPAQDQEFVLMHADNIQATGFVEHIKLPHYVDFQSELELIRKIRAEAMQVPEDPQ